MYPQPGYMPVSVKANGDWAATFAFTDDAGVPVAVSLPITCQVRAADGAPAVLGTGTVTIIDDAGGLASLRFEGSDFAYLVPGNEEWRGAFDVVAEIGGSPYVLLEGPFTVRPGVTIP